MPGSGWIHSRTLTRIQKELGYINIKHLEYLFVGCIFENLIKDELLKIRSIHISIITYFYLAIFISALVIKDTHHCTFSHDILVKNAHSSLLSKAEKPCPICQFEFVHFISKSFEHIFVCHSVSCTINTRLADDIYKISFSSYSHRAPPSI